MDENSCPIPSHENKEVEEILLMPEKKTADYQEAMRLARAEADKRLGENMLMSWYDRDRDYESPPNTTEKPGDGPKNGYVHYGLNHGAKLKVDIEEGRFVFFFAPVEW